MSVPTDIDDEFSVRFAHSLAGKPEADWELLVDHLTAVGRRAAAFAADFGCAELARVAGQLHDIGKCSQDYLDYIRQPVERDRSMRGPDHSTAGAREATGKVGSPLFGRALALVIAGHHAGLGDPDEIQRRLDPDRHTIADYKGWESYSGPIQAPSALKPTIVFPSSKIPTVGKGFSQAFLIRMLFSCLVDADFLETEMFMQGGTAARGVEVGLDHLLTRLRVHMGNVRVNAAPTALNLRRSEILDHVISKAAMPSGFFTLTVPTGGGKTLASLSFALEHACAKDKRRIIYVIPFTSIIEQTADVFRKALDEPDAVLEHHASFDWERAARREASEDGGDKDGLGRLRRAAENWDAPIVVTTAVQFFESLFANRTSACRKLHNLANSVIVLDEVQTLPLPVLRPCMAALDELRRCYGVTIVLCTATQPAWRQIDEALMVKRPNQQPVNLGLDIDEEHELAPQPRDLYREFRRVNVEVLAGKVDDARIVARFADVRPMLCIVNSRAHARHLFDLIAAQPGAAHLTTLMCPAHRRQVIGMLRQRLKEQLPVRLVATSLIEAGVDISFGEVWRAWAGLESIAQAAGRCNREGELLPDLGRVVVFEPAEHQPPSQLKVFQQAARKVVRDQDDPLTLDAVKAYFKELYFVKGIEELDATIIGQLRGALAALDEGAGADCRFPFRSLAEAFRLIDEVMEPVIVPWRADRDDRAVDTLLDRIARTEHALSADLRHLQQYIVGIPKKARGDWLAMGVLVPVRPDLGDALLRFQDLSHYRPDTGVDLADPTVRRAEANIW
jgi:CRISPR-associated endonuclease/helicase Cas3